MDKPVVLLTGRPGIGKTTMFKKICEKLKNDYNVDLQGFYTEEVLNFYKQREGFDVITFDGKRATLARPFSGGSLPNVSKYAVTVTEFNTVALPTLKLNNKTKILAVDEVGKMELSSNDFKRDFEQCIGVKPIFATVPLTVRNIPTVEKLQSAPNSKIFKLTAGNRVQIENELMEHLLESLNIAD